MSAVTIPAPRETIRTEEIARRTRGSFVYGWRRGDEYLYIGATNRGIRRLLNRHHAIDAGGGFQPDDVVDIWEPNGSVFNLERQLIQQHHPKLNVVHAAPRPTTVAPPVAMPAPRIILSETAAIEKPFEGSLNAFRVYVVIEHWRGPLAYREGELVPVDPACSWWSVDSVTLRREDESFAEIVQAEQALRNAALQYKRIANKIAVHVRGQDGIWRHRQTGEVMPAPSYLVENAPILEAVVDWEDIGDDDAKRAAVSRETSAGAE